MHKIKDFLFTNRSLRQTVIKNTIWLTVANVVGRAIRALLVIYAARVLGVAGFGVFSYALSFAALFLSLDVGINGIVNRDLAKENTSKEKFISTSFFIKLGFGLVAYTTLIIVSFFTVQIKAAYVVIPLIGLSLLLDSFKEFGFSIIRALQKMEVEAGATIIYQIGSVIFGLIIISVWTTPLALASAYFIGSMIGVIIIFYYLKNYFINIIKNYDWSLAKSVIHDAWPFAIIAFGNLLLLYTDTLLLGWLKTEIDVGYYSAASRILQIINFLPSLLIMAIFPIITQKVTKGNARSLIEKSFALMLLVGLPIAIGGFLMPELPIILFFGDKYLSAVPIFQILILMTAAGFVVSVLGYVLLAHNKQMVAVKYTLGAAAINIFLNYFFIQWYGAKGAAIATVIAQSVAAIGQFIEVWKIEKIKIFPHIWRIILATVAMAIFIMIFKIFPIPLWLIFAASPIFYFGFLKIIQEPLLKELSLD